MSIDMYWIDTETGTCGEVDDLRIVDHDSVSVDLNELSDSERAKFALTYGYSIEDDRTASYEQGEKAGRADEDPYVTEQLEALDSLRKAVEAMLEQLDIDGTCQLCEMGFNFHSADCVIHPVNNALDRIDY